MICAEVSPTTPSVTRVVVTTPLESTETVPLVVPDRVTADTGTRTASLTEAMVTTTEAVAPAVRCDDADFGAVTVTPKVLAPLVVEDVGNNALADTVPSTEVPPAWVMVAR